MPRRTRDTEGARSQIRIFERPNWTCFASLCLTGGSVCGLSVTDARRGAAVGPISLTIVGYTSVQNGTPSHLYSNRATRRARCLSHRFSAELAAVELATCPSPTSGDRTYHSYRSFGTAKLRSQRMWCGRRTARRLGFRSSMVSAGLLFCSKCLALEPCCLPWSPPTSPVRNASEPTSCRRIVPMKLAEGRTWDTSPS